MIDKPNSNDSLRKLGDNTQIAWCMPGVKNEIQIYTPTTGSITEFQGCGLDQGWHTLLHSIPGSYHLISSNSPIITATSGAKFEVFDTSKKISKLFTYEQPNGNIADISYNNRSGIAALFSIKDKYTYHLFQFPEWELIKKAEWLSPHKDVITGLDFSPCEQRIVTVGLRGVFVISDVATNDVVCDLEFGDWNRCRWNPFSPWVAVTFDKSNLNIIDVIKREKRISPSLQPHKECKLLNCDTCVIVLKDINWIDWHKEGNVLVSSSDNKTLKILDVRSGGVVKSIERIHSGYIISVKWSPCGEMLATASSDDTAKLIDFATGKPLLTNKMPENSTLSL